jgi:hypothetical protein
VAVGGLVLIVLVACGADAPATDSASEAPANPSSASTGTAVVVEDPWAKAAESGTTAAFGTLVNPGDADVRVVAASTPAAAAAELHEVAMTDGQMVMREKPDGFVIPAGGELVLEPGAEHVMLIDLVAPLAPGDEVDIVLTLDDSTTVGFTAQAKDFSGADEDYRPGAASAAP